MEQRLGEGKSRNCIHKHTSVQKVYHKVVGEWTFYGYYYVCGDCFTLIEEVK